jgi:hypothetical protein
MPYKPPTFDSEEEAHEALKEGLKGTSEALEQEKRQDEIANLPPLSETETDPRSAPPDPRIDTSVAPPPYYTN